jgi:DNA topoisomerase-3
MTSVSGHLLSQDFDQSYKSWNSCDPLELFNAPIKTFCKDDYQPIKKTLEREAKNCNKLIIWTDCDREGFLIRSIHNSIKLLLNITFK